MTRLTMRVRAEDPMCSWGARRDVARGRPAGGSMPPKPVTEQSCGTRRPAASSLWMS